jgi:hypothetical protein
MKEVQGFDRSYWMPLFGKYLHNNDKTYTYFPGQSDGHGNAPVSYCAHRLIEEVQAMQWKPLDAAIGRVFAPIISIGHSYIVFVCFFSWATC